MNNDIKYIKDNFIEAQDLCEVADISREELLSLIERELIPVSYTHLTLPTTPYV